MSKPLILVTGATEKPGTPVADSKRTILQRLEQWLFLKESPNRIHYLERPDYESATGLAGHVIEQMARDFQVAPPVTLHLAHPRLMAGVWAICRESLFAGEVDRSKREAIAAMTSRINECPFCVDAHTSMLHGLHEHRLARPKWT